MVELTETAPVGDTIASVTRASEPYRVPAPTAQLVNAGTVDHVAAPGDWFEYRVGWLSVIVLRTEDGTLRAYQNVCRHRGNVLACGEGRQFPRKPPVGIEPTTCALQMRCSAS